MSTHHSNIRQSVNVLQCAKSYYTVMIKNRVSLMIGLKKMDRREVVKLTGIDRQTLRKIYKGETKSISFDTLDKLCFALDCTTNDLFKYIPDDLADKHLYE